MTYRCPNGHRVDRIRVIACPECRANVVYEPSAHGMALMAKLVRLRALAVLVSNHSDIRVRRFGRIFLKMIDEDS